MRVTEAEEPVRLVRREDVRDRVGVANDVDRRGQAVDLRRAVHLRQRPAQIQIPAERDDRRDERDRHDRFQQHTAHDRIIPNSQVSTFNSQPFQAEPLSLES
jgi:hypothetical protein